MFTGLIDGDFKVMVMERKLRRKDQNGGANKDLAAEVTAMMYPQDNGVRERWEPQKLNSLHRQILLLAFDASMNQKEIAEYLKITPMMVSLVINSELGRQHLDYLHDRLDDEVLENVEKSITDIQPYAFEIQKQIMLNGTSESVRLRAAQDFMDRGGTGVKQGGTSENYGTKSKIEEIKQIAEERRMVARKTTIEEVFLSDKQPAGDL